jgi:large subunit ribosomal protein L25
MITLEYKTRKIAKDLTDLRKEGLMPAVFYGKKETSTPIMVLASDFIKVWKQTGESEVVALKEGDKVVNTLIHDVSVDALTGKPLHADFYVFEKGQKIEIDVPLEFVGVSPAIKELGANLIKVMHELKVSASPENLPHNIEVDISSIVTLDDQILVKDIKLPAGVTFVDDADDVVASVEGQRAEEVDEPSAPIDLSSIEVEKKGKKEEEGESAE